MRLRKLDTGHRAPAKIFMTMIAKVSGAELADVVKTFLYRPEFFGRPMVKLSAEVMRGPSFWTAGEREYIALRTARLHQTPYCVDIHTELVRIAASGEIEAAAGGLARPEVTAVVDFLERLARSPESAAGSLARARESGVTDEAIIEALHVAFVWNVVNRLAHSFGYQLREGQLAAGTRALHRFKYRLPGFTLR